MWKKFTNWEKNKNVDQEKILKYYWLNKNQIRIEKLNENCQKIKK